MEAPAMTAIRRVLPQIFMVLSVLPSAQGATWTTIDVPGAILTRVYGINSVGDAVGDFLDTAEVEHGFLLRGGNFTIIDVPGATSTAALGINDNGQISGSFGRSGEKIRGFLLEGQNWTILDFPDSLGTSAGGINNAGEIVGSYDTPDNFHGFTWNNGQFVTVDGPTSFTVLYAVNNLGNIVGLDGYSPYSGFAINPKGMFRIFGPKRLPYGVNDHKVIVGADGKNGFSLHLKTDLLVRMRFPHSLGTMCHGINNNGQIVGEYEDGAGVTHGFLRTK